MSKQIGEDRKYGRYSPSKLSEAVKMVKQGMSRKAAARKYGVPRTTLVDKLSGKSPLGAKPGPSAVLSSAEEDMLIKYCKQMKRIGYPITKLELLAEVKKVLDNDGRKTPFKGNVPGKDWFTGFRKRHPELADLLPGFPKAKIVNKTKIDGWFDGLQGYLSKEVQDWDNLIKDPRRIFNAGQQRFPLCVKTGRVIAEKGTSSKLQLTVMACFNAVGNYVPPLIVYPDKGLKDCGTKDFPEAIYGHTQSGGIDSALFVAYYRHLLQIVDNLAIPKPILLFVNGHSTHMTLDASRFCRENGIILYCLLPNATHLLQACDIGLFEPMNSMWKVEVKQWQLDHQGEIFTKKAFPGVYRKAWHRVAKPENAVQGFQRCGLFPLNRDNVDMKSE